jgi:hypothetical protein
MRKLLAARVKVRFALPVWVIASLTVLILVVDLWLWPAHPWWLFLPVGAAFGFAAAMFERRAS